MTNKVAPAEKSRMRTVRVLPLGDGRVFTGVARENGAPATFGRGEMFDAPAATAEALQARGLVEIL